MHKRHSDVFAARRIWRAVSRIIFCIVPLAVGCSRTDDADRGKANGDLVLMEVNGRQFLRSDYDLRVKTRLHLLELAVPQREFLQMKEKAEGSIRSAMGDLFLQETLLKSAAEDYFRTNATASAEREKVSAVVREEMAAKFSTGTGSNALDFAQIVSKLPEDERKCFNESFESDVGAETFFRIAYSDEWNLSDAAVAQALTNLVEYNARAQATNIVAFALATNVWEQALAGVDFGELADKYSQEDDKKPGGDLGECGKVDFSDDEETWEAIAALEPGGVTPPLLTYSGIEIFKLIKKVPADESDSGEEALHLAHIMFRRAMEVQDYTPESYRKEMETVGRNKRMKAVLLQEWKRATVQFPNGQDVLPPMNWRKIKGFPSGKAKKEPEI